MEPVVLIATGAGALLVIVVIVLLCCRKKKQEDPTYHFRRDELSGLWVCTDPKKETTLLFDRMMVTCGRDIAFYKTKDSFPEDKELRDIVWTDGALRYQNLLYHMEEINGALVSVISAMRVENPGRGLYVAEEYVKKERRELVPAAYVSPFAEQLNEKLL